MPEMLRHAGKRYTISRRVDKICDTISTTGSRRMQAAVYLEDLRCDGSGHDGCQAGCKIYWKDAWLRRVDGSATESKVGATTSMDLAALTKAGSRTMREIDGVRAEVWRCQATEASNATHRLRGFDPRPYWRELTNGNFGPIRFLRIFVYLLFWRLARSLGLVKRFNTPLKGKHTT